MKRISLALAFLMALSLPVSAQDFDKGMAAYKAGDYASAVQEWTPLAAAGNEKAQSLLGVMYEFGNGVPQDYKKL